MEIIKINDCETVENAIIKNEPLIAVVSFDEKQAYVSHLDDSVEHHILLNKAGCSPNDIDKYFRIIFDNEGADWTFICPSNYKNIKDKSRRTSAFYKDGFTAIANFLSEFGYLIEIKIPKRYRRHLENL